MQILILGGDGYLGWPTAMHLSAHGHEVAIVDNYLRRRMCLEQGVEPLFPVPDMHRRAAIWEKVTGKRIAVHVGDLRRWDFVSEVFQSVKPDAVLHYAEQPSAPYSMLDRRTADLTLSNNIGVTANVIFAVREFCPDAQIVKIGTMGEYGTPNIDIEEGWLEIDHKGRKDKFLYPRQASSLYHTTKVMDTDLLWFYVRTWGLRATDLMQGPVYGIMTDENENNPELMPFFNYDELFGTVLNRFVVQAVVGYPLTVYGQGGQTRGYLNIKDTLQCVRLSLEQPARKGELRIFNQFTETFSVNDLADKVVRIGKDLGLHVSIRALPNPRKEAEEHYYNPVHTGLLDLGLKPNYLTDDVLAQMMQLVMKYSAAVRPDIIFKSVKWS
ncbi:UDP-sulfoquinovose synthase [Desulfonatronum thiosulfatophilum]|uniref:UDP-sulfoquinovose synthase n=1 Tax=Desulfonatronum thiosulfatophilum TaxID=617002 RepID=A0A1G6EL72_9BACT|nr:NAD-dependent epimerase/dehydratase family protein [Desulfonatronum thiosulfatophilum]SDB58148.1 UDP-sulfoquinovose synthase [Desulfonatronum thiosulfatophilum]